MKALAAVALALLLGCGSAEPPPEVLNIETKPIKRNEDGANKE